MPHPAGISGSTGTAAVHAHPSRIPASALVLATLAAPFAAALFLAAAGAATATPGQAWATFARLGSSAAPPGLGAALLALPLTLLWLRDAEASRWRWLGTGIVAGLAGAILLAACLAGGGRIAPAPGDATRMLLFLMVSGATVMAGSALLARFIALRLLAPRMRENMLDAPPGNAACESPGTGA